MANEGTRETWAATGRLPEGLIYPELVHSGMSETLVQNTDAFNAASLNTIRQVTARRMGDFVQESFFKNVSNLISRRQVNVSPTNPDVSASEIPKEEHISVKLNRRVGPIDQSYDSFRKLGQSADLEVISFTLGEQIAKAIQIDWLESGLTAVTAALENQADVYTNFTGSPDRTMTTDFLVQTLAQFGDAASRVRLWVMHSKVYYDLVRNQIASNIDGTSNFNIATATPVTLNRPVLVTDSAALIRDADTGEASPIASEPQYVTLGLSEDALVLEDSEEEMLYSDVITGKENIVARLQGEFAYNVKCKGFKWDTANGGVNPDNTALATGTNWDAVMDSFKDFAGVAAETS